MKDTESGPGGGQGDSKSGQAGECKNDEIEK